MEEGAEKSLNISTLYMRMSTTRLAECYEEHAAILAAQLLLSLLPGCFAY